MSSSEPRFVGVSRRAFLTRSAVVGTVLVVPGLACATSDEDVFSSATTVGTAGASTTSATAASGSTTSRGSSPSTSTATTAPTGDTFPTGGELIVGFTFAASGGRVNNPYIAVWVEEADGELVDTISVWFKQGKGEKWLPDLRRWYAVSGGASVITMSSATRVPGSYRVTWDGTDLDGNPVPAGDLVLHIEAAREHGPYELISETITIGDQPFRLDLTPSGELTAASAELVV